MQDGVSLKNGDRATVCVLSTLNLGWFQKQQFSNYDYIVCFVIPPVFNINRLFIVIVIIWPIISRLFGRKAHAYLILGSVLRHATTYQRFKYRRSTLLQELKILRTSVEFYVLFCFI